MLSVLLSSADAEHDESGLSLSGGSHTQTPTLLTGVSADVGPPGGPQKLD